MSGGLVTHSAATATAEPVKVHKSYVCKYVSIPGEAERLEYSATTRFWVDNHAIPGRTTGSSVEVGDVFVDKHDKSVVIVCEYLASSTRSRVSTSVRARSTTARKPCRQRDSPPPPLWSSQRQPALPTSPDGNGVTDVLLYDGLSWSVLITAPAGKTLALENGATTKTVSGSFTDLDAARYPPRRRSWSASMLELASDLRTTSSLCR